MDSYILKLYRKEGGDGHRVAGLLEDVLSGTEVNFRNFEELRKLLLNGFIADGKEVGSKKHTV